MVRTFIKLFVIFWRTTAQLDEGPYHSISVVHKISIEYAKSTFEYGKTYFISYSKIFFSRTAPFSTHHGTLKIESSEDHMMRMIANDCREPFINIMK